MTIFKRVCSLRVSSEAPTYADAGLFNFFKCVYLVEVTSINFESHKEGRFFLLVSLLVKRKINELGSLAELANIFGLISIFI